MTFNLTLDEVNIHLHSLAVLASTKGPWYPLNKRRVWLRSGHDWKHKHFCSCRGSNPGYPLHSHFIDWAVLAHHDEEEDIMEAFWHCWTLKNWCFSSPLRVSPRNSWRVFLVLKVSSADALRNIGKMERKMMKHNWLSLRSGRDIRKRKARLFGIFKKVWEGLKTGIGCQQLPLLLTVGCN